MNAFLHILDKVSSCFVFTSIAFYVWSKLLNKKIKIKELKFYILYVFTVIFSILNYYLVNDFFRIISIVVFLAIIMKMLFNESIKKTIVTIVFYELIIVISEGIFALILNLAFNMNSVQIVNTQFGNFVANTVIAIITILLMKTKFVKKSYEFINTAVDKLKEEHLIVMNLLIVIIVSILESMLYFDVDYRYLLIFNTLLIVFCFCTILYSFKNKNNYIKVYDKYNTTLNSLKEYEDILDRYRISNHENKNQLLSIRNMLSKNNKKIIDYIDLIVENRLTDDDKIMIETARIPAGGLRGLIYSKLLFMKESNIDYQLQLSKEIKTVNLINNIDDKTMLDICKIVGVFLDNSIQEVKQHNKKIINIDMYLDNEFLYISISNNYEGNLEFDLIGEKGYTTKGKNRGYGLALVKQIVENNDKIINEKRVSKNIFAQVLKIKI